MIITVKYFGAIAEATGLQEEKLDMSALGTKLEDLRDHCLHKYGAINDLTFKLAVNQSIEEEMVLKDGDEVAFLPPFAGG
ncbi:MoaD/ThiS family protein [Balneola sp. MJW-20]|uniref:MoaD/ThiS family protein n=1 Tax=Gracilimonas aurantiaca TaxID=3234185 RepID=UPI0034670C06